MLQPRPSALRHSHPYLSPTYTRSVFEGGFELLRPSVRSTPSPTTHSEGLMLRVGALPCAPTYNRGVVQHVAFNRGVCPATRMQLEGRHVPCKQYYCASGLQQHLIICTEDVTAPRRTLQRLQISSRDTTVSSSSSNPRTNANWLIFFILCLRRRYVATTTVTAAT